MSTPSCQHPVLHVQRPRYHNISPLSALPSAFETANLLFNEVFQFYGFPENIVSDWGPQSRVWRGFIKRLAIIVSLTSDLVQWPSGESQPGNREVPAVILFTQPGWLGKVSPMGGLCTEFLTPFCHWTNTSHLFSSETPITQECVPSMTGSNKVNRSGKRHINDWKELLRPANTLLTIATVTPHPTNLVTKCGCNSSCTNTYTT